MERDDTGDDIVGDTHSDQELKRLRQLRLLVTVLTATMIIGISAVLVIVFLSFSQIRARGDSPKLPDAITLPAGEVLDAITRGNGWSALVTTDGSGQQRIHLVDNAGALFQTVVIERAP